MLGAQLAAGNLIATDVQAVCEVFRLRQRAV